VIQFPGKIVTKDPVREVIKRFLELDEKKNLKSVFITGIYEEGGNDMVFLYHTRFEALPMLAVINSTIAAATDEVAQRVLEEYED